jgi:hypothetical protein
VAADDLDILSRTRKKCPGHFSENAEFRKSISKCPIVLLLEVVLGKDTTEENLKRSPVQIMFNRSSVGRALPRRPDGGRAATSPCFALIPKPQGFFHCLAPCFL